MEKLETTAFYEALGELKEWAFQNGMMNKIISADDEDKSGKVFDEMTEIITIINDIEREYRTVVESNTNLKDMMKDMIAADKPAAKGKK